MPTRNEKTFYRCNSTKKWEQKVKGSKGDIYYVRFRQQYNENSVVDFAFDCTCKGYNYRAKCRHIDLVKKLGAYCGWDQFLRGGELNEEGRCPSCGGDVHIKKHQVKPDEERP